MYDKLVIVVLISSVTIYSMTSSAEKPKIVSNYLEGWENYQMTLMGFSEKKIHIVCSVCPNFQGDFFSDLMFYTNTSSSLRNVLDENQFVVEDVNTFGSSTMTPSPVDLLVLVWDSPPPLASHSPDWALCTWCPTIVSLPLCQPVDLISCFSLSAVLSHLLRVCSSGNVGLQRTWWQQG